MADVIRVVKGDELPTVTLTLTDDVTGSAIDLSAGTTSVSIKFRAVGSTTVSSTITCTKSTDGADGKVNFNFSSGVLDVDEGMNEGEIIINKNGSLQTVYDLLKFRVRASF